jgi:hypothetical protein
MGRRLDAADDPDRRPPALTACGFRPAAESVFVSDH